MFAHMTGCRSRVADCGLQTDIIWGVIGGVCVRVQGSGEVRDCVRSCIVGFHTGVALAKF